MQSDFPSFLAFFVSSVRGIIEILLSQRHSEARRVLKREKMAVRGWRGADFARKQLTKKQKICIFSKILKHPASQRHICTEDTMSVNKNYKDSVFTALFNQPDPLRDLYCAIKDVTLPPDVPVSINTLEKKVQSRTLYSKKQVAIPWPEFYVLYNGPEPFPDDAVLRLSDLFEKPEELGFTKMACPLLELEVRVININEGRNKAIANRCSKLAEYSAFMAKVRTFREELGSLEEGIKAAIKYCSVHAIPKEFLEIHGSEVLNMILTEWNTEDAIAFAREEGREEGLERGFEKGRERGLEKGREEVMELLAQGLTAEEIKVRLAKITN